MSDLIDRQKAIDAALTFIVEYCGAAFDEDMQKMLCERLGDLPSAEPEKWTPVTEALPEEDEEVLVTVRFDGTKDVKPSVYVETASQIGGLWTSYSDEWKVARSKHHVIAWMLLPKPLEM